jgi:hypothetical protein
MLKEKVTSLTNGKIMKEPLFMVLELLVLLLDLLLL